MLQSDFSIQVLSIESLFSPFQKHLFAVVQVPHRYQGRRCVEDKNSQLFKKIFLKRCPIVVSFLIPPYGDGNEAPSPIRAMAPAV